MPIKPHATPGVPRAVVLPVPPLVKPKRTRQPAWVHHVLRHHDIYQPQPAAGLRTPSMLVSTRGRRWGPTSGRPSKNKHKRSGSANLCHRARPQEAAPKHDARQWQASLDRLRQMHLNLMRDVDSGRSAEARYERARSRHLAHWPADLHVIDRMEAGHIVSER